MPRIYLQTFLRNACADSVGKANRLARYGDPGGDGHDHYWSLKSSAKRLVIQQQPFDQACEVFANMALGPEQSNNKAALGKLDTWRHKHRGLGFEAPIGILAAPKGVLLVRVEPEFGIVTGKHKEVYLLWTSRSAELPKGIAGIGVLAMHRALKHGKFSDHEFYILDLDKGVRYGAGSISKHADLALSMELVAQEEICIASKKPPAA